MPEADWGPLQWFQGERNRKITESGPDASSGVRDEKVASYNVAEVSPHLTEEAAASNRNQDIRK